MRRPLRRLAAGLVLPAALLGGSCLFSTTPPKPAGSTSENVDPNAAVVTGSVQLYDRTDHHSRNMPGWLVRALWYVAAGAGEPLRLVDVDVTTSDGGGTYEVLCTNTDIVAVDVQARICAVDLEGMDCCLLDPPCNRPECTSIWTAPQRILIGPGIRERRTLRVPCDHAP